MLVELCVSSKRLGVSSANSSRYSLFATTRTSRIQSSVQQSVVDRVAEMSLQQEMQAYSADQQRKTGV